MIFTFFIGCTSINQRHPVPQLQRRNILFQFFKATIGILRNIRIASVDQAIGKQEHLHTQFLSDHILIHIVAYPLCISFLIFDSISISYSP